MMWQLCHIWLKDICSCLDACLHVCVHCGSGVSTVWVISYRMQLLAQNLACVQLPLQTEACIV